MTEREKLFLFFILTILFGFVNGDIETMINEPVASVLLFAIWLVLGYAFVCSGGSK